MLKTIKRTEQMRLDELIKYCRDNDIKNKSFYTVSKGAVRFNEYGEPVSVPSEIKFDNKGRIVLWGYLDPEDLFLVEIEKKITGDTVFDELVERYESKEIPYKSTDVHINSSIKDILKPNRYTESESTQIYALIDDELQLIWKKKD